jgi:CRISPR-associated endonuclease/helicase Cas3
MFLSHPIFNEKHDLVEHSITVAKKTREILNETNLNISNIGFYAGLFHDIGKLNPLYQIAFLEKSEDEVKKKIKELESIYLRWHAPFSEFIALFVLKDLGLETYERDKISSVIYHHHSSLQNPPSKINNDHRIQITQKQIANKLKEFKSEVSKIQEFSTMNWDNCLDKLEKIPLYPDFRLSEFFPKNYFEEYIKNSCLFSALLQADKGSFNDWKLLNFDLDIDTSGLVSSSKSHINVFRTKFQSQAIENIDISKDINVLEAPTGIGKTKVFLDMISKYKESNKLDRVFYFSPFLALTDDFIEKQLLEKNIVSKFQRDRVLEYNHLFSGSLEKKSNEKKIQNKDDIDKIYKWDFEDESFNRNFIITTTTRLLMTLYSNRNNDKMKLISLRKSLLILDEVQTLPKFILSNLVEYLQKLAKFLHCKILLVSATIPYPLQVLPKIEVDRSIFDEYQKITKKKILFSQRQIKDISGKKILVMANTRKKASSIYLEYKKKFNYTNIYYISSGIRKTDRLDIFSKLREKKTDVLCIATPAIEAGINISFSQIYREAAPIDNIIQVLGRLNREKEYDDNVLLTIFQDDNNPSPYNDIEYMKSIPILKQIHSSDELYMKLKGYYEIIFKENQRDKDRAQFLQEDMKNMDFEKIWDKVRKYTYEEDETNPVIIPLNHIEIGKIKDSILYQGKVTREIRRSCAKYMANLPHEITPYNPKIKHMFDEKLFKEFNFLIPKPEYLYDPNKKDSEYLYDPNIGLDKWIPM